MKRFISILLTAVLLAALFAFASCNAPAQKTPDPVSAADEPALPNAQLLNAPAAEQDPEESTPADPEPSAEPVRTWHLSREECTHNTGRTNCSGGTDFSAIHALAENRDYLEIQDYNRLPLPAFKAGSVEELSALATSLTPYLGGSGNYDEAFFEEYGLVFVYVFASSGSYRFDLFDLDCQDGHLLATVENLTLTEAAGKMIGVTEDIAEWMVCAEVPRDLYDGVTLFDAAMMEGQEH